MDLVDNLPRTKEMASIILDFPEPLGPTIEVKFLEKVTDTVLLP
jgi:hypothetical protein